LDQIKGILSLFATLGLVVTLAGYFGAAHPAFDSVGAFRLQALVGFGLLLVLSIGIGALVARALALVGIAVAAIGVLPALAPTEEVAEADLVIYSHNLRYDNPDIAAVAQAIRAEQADVVLVQEISAETRPLMDLLAAEFPTRIFCPFSDVGGLAVLSRLPARDASGCASGLGFVWATLRRPDGGEVTVASIHLAWPWPHGQRAHVARLEPLLAALPRPLVIAGDFNMAPWGDSVARVAAASGTRILPGLQPSFHKPGLWPALPLDHVLVSEEITAHSNMLARFGSDHNALKTRIKLKG